MTLLFFILLGLLIYIFFAFPLIFMVLALFNRPPKPSRFEPRVDVLIAARNESRRIGAKIINTLASDYPADKLSIIIASDGSTDGTDNVVAACADARVHLISISKSHGKTSAINTLSQAALAEILVMSDADVLVAPNAIRELVAPFADPRVGAVCGRRSDRAEGAAEVSWPARLYNLYEGAIKRGEGTLGRVLGGDGSLYAIRRTEVCSLPVDVPDDFVNVLRILARGQKVLYASKALSWEELAGSGQAEFARKRRTVARGIRGLRSVHSLLNPLRFPVIALLLLSHKILRWGAGFIMLALLILNAALVAHPFYCRFFLGQLIFYILALAGGLGLRGALWKPIRMIRYFVLTNLAASLGVIDVLRRHDWNSWTTPRA